MSPLCGEYRVVSFILEGVSLFGIRLMLDMVSLVRSRRDSDIGSRNSYRPSKCSTVPRFRTASEFHNSSSVAMLENSTINIFGIAAHCEPLLQNFLNNFAASDVMSSIGRVLLLFQLSTVFPLNAYVMRIQLFRVLFPLLDYGFVACLALH